MGKFHSNSNPSLDDRMKNNYEFAYKFKMPRRMPVILRLDGKAFHTLTRGLDKPFDTNLMKIMQNTVKYLVENIQGAVLGYTQSDEISILLMNYKRLNTSSWFDNNIQKIVSISAGMASSFFTLEFQRLGMFEKINRNPFPIVFDSRTFTLPEAEVNNYFISRQNDCERNAIQMIGQSHYSSKQLNGKKCKDIIKMINEDNNIIKKYDDYSVVEKMGYVFGNSKNYMGEFMCKFKEIGEGIINSLLEQEEI